MAADSLGQDHDSNARLKKGKLEIHTTSEGGVLFVLGNLKSMRGMEWSMAVQVPERFLPFYSRAGCRHRQLNSEY